MNDALAPANLLTSSNLAAGFLALILAEQGEFGWAAGCVGVAAGCDAVDGLVARLTRSECAFGSQLDSLADLVSFGVAPALILYFSALQLIPGAGLACLAFVLCGGWRLARFQAGEESRRHFVGLPIPPAGLITVGLALLDLPSGVALGCVVLVSVLMVSRLPFPTLAELRRLGLPARRAAASRRASG
jgi:CDP-diacylglycerol--serine O-phosphatidyltransferase